MKNVTISFNESLCKGCELCVAACPKNLIALNKTKINANGYYPAYVENMEDCVGCGSCAISCPDSAIRIEAE